MDRNKESAAENNQLSGLRLALLPVYNSELSKFLPMCGMIFFTIFTFSLLRSLKDPLIVTAPGSGAEVLSFLKIYVVMPMTIISSILYMRLRKSFDLYASYNMIIGVFVTFFFLFGLIIYPNTEYLHMSVDQLQALQDAYPSLRYPVVMVGLWSYAMFYVFSELWGTFALSVLFWQFANDTTSSEQAKRFYPLYVMAGNIALIALYPVIKHIASNTQSDMQEASAVAVFCGLALMGIFKYLSNVIASEKLESTDIKPKKKKKKLSFTESLAVLMRSEYVGCIALLVLSYGIIINLVELIWKAELKQLYPSRSDFIAFNADYTFLTGVATIIMNYLSKGIIRKMGWGVGAIITPLSCGVCSSLFFIFVLNKDYFSSVLLGMGIVPLFFSVWFGAYGVLISKGSKYSFFDPTKEMAFIPLDDDLRTNGKAAVDGIGGRLGKSAGGLFSSTLFMIMGSPPAIEIAPILAVVVILLTVVWIGAVLRLSNLYNNKIKDDTEENGGAVAAAV